MSDYDDGPVWNAFGMTRAAYLVLPRRALQSMPREWQEKFVALVDELHTSLPDGTLDGNYVVTMKIGNKFASDPMLHYRRTGPLPLKPAAEQEQMT